MASLHISIKAEEVFQLSGIKITNSLLTTWIVMAILILLALLIRSKIKKNPGKLQIIAEMIIGGIYGLFESILGAKTPIFFPLVGTLFFFIIFLNWFGLLPGVGTIGVHALSHGKESFIPLFRAGTADLNTTLAFAVISVLFIQYFGLKSLGVSYLAKFFNFKNPIYTFVGILEFVSEFTKIISFAFRLFGNVFAGEVLLTVIVFLIPLFVPMPFIAMELFVGFIQALVFSMLTSVFLLQATESHEQH